MQVALDLTGNVIFLTLAVKTAESVDLRWVLALRDLWVRRDLEKWVNFKDGPRADSLLFFS